VVRASTDQLQPGWDLIVPAASTTDNAARTAPAHAPNDDQPDIATAWTVTPGEHFWGKAADTLGQAWNRPPTDQEIVPYWQQLIDTNRDQLAPPHDPDLIHPGQQFQVPAPPPDPNDAPPAETPQPEFEPDLELDSADDGPEPDVDPAAPNLDETSAGPAAPVEPDEATPAVPARPDHLTLDLVPDQTATTEAATPNRTSPARTVLGVPAELSGAAAGTALAAAGIVALLARRRRTALQQRATTLRLPTPAPALVDHLGSLAAAAPADPVLDEVVDLLSTIPEELHPALVLLHDSGPISLVFDDDAAPTAPPAPWTLDTDDDGPIRWTAQLGSRGPRRSIGLPLLLTLGRTETTTVLANLAALGTLPVTGPADQVRTRLRAAALELACSRTAGPLEVVVIGDDHHLDVEQLRYTDDPDETLAALADDAEQGIIADDRLPRAIICHDPDRTIDLPPAAVGFGAALIAADSPTSSWQLDLDGPTTWLYLPGGHRHELTSPDVRPDLIADELDRLDLDNAVPAPPAPTNPDLEPGPDPDDELLVVHDADPPASDDPWCHIGLLGPLQVTLGDQPLTRLTPTVRQLLPYLATHRHGVTLARLEETIWPGRPGSPNGQRTRTALTRLRAELGDAPDGTPLIPRRASGDQPIRLSDHVTTDLDQALQHLDTARTGDAEHQLQHLLAALDLIRGEPFEDLCFSWTLDVQQHAITHLHDAALTAAGALRRLGRYDDAEHAIRQGLTLYDPSEPLYVEWFHLEHARGHPERIPHLWHRLRQRYADQADETAGVITTPTIETELAYTTLTRNRPA